MTIDRPEAFRDRGCRQGTRENLALAMAYVPMQCLKNAYSLEEALMQGTLFPELNKPFTGVRGGCACG
ncbi:MAG: spore coat associated protein CotJA [Clostridiales bacterium]|nr:spore coat associated protein CotJA [Clostridiales bacterium]